MFSVHIHAGSKNVPKPHKFIGANNMTQQKLCHHFFQSTFSLPIFTFHLSFESTIVAHWPKLKSLIFPGYPGPNQIILQDIIGNMPLKNTAKNRF